VGLWWLSATWSSLRVSEQEDVSPAGAWARCLIPVYGYYWGVWVHVLLCRNMNEALGRRDAHARVSPILAALAALATFISAKWPVLAAIPGVLWFLYMHQIDVARRVLSENR
jgi:hypothetical protein